MKASREPDFTFVLGDDVDHFARMVKAQKNTPSIRTYQDHESQRFWSQTTSEDIAALTRRIEELLAEHGDDVEGFRAALATAEFAIPVHAEPLETLVAEITTWRLPSPDRVDRYGQRSSERRNLVIDDRVHPGEANAVAVWEGSRFRRPRTENRRVERP